MTDTNNSGTAPRRVGRNPQQEKAQVRKVLALAAFKKLPVRRCEIGGKGKERIFTLFTVKPTAFTDEVKARLAEALKAELKREPAIVVTAEAFAIAKSVRRTPLKVRHVLSLVRGQKVNRALDILKFTPNFAADDIFKVVKSAASNAENGWGAGMDELVISECYADKAAVMKRFRPGPMGRARPILKFLSHITIVVADASAER
jgi:large subunit ribosomal protein L22